MQEARQKREAAEFEAWKGLISVDGAGEDAASEAQLRQRRQELCDRLKTGRVRSLWPPGRRGAVSPGLGPSAAA